MSASSAEPSEYAPLYEPCPVPSPVSVDTSPAAATEWRVEWGATTLVNVTGAVLIEMGTPAAAANIDV